jgi:hypothetical protein
MAEAGVSYRAWAPVLPAAWVFREVMARASEITGHDWSQVERAPREGEGGAGDAAASGSGGSGARRAALVGAGSVLVAGLLAFLLLAEANAPERESAEGQLKIERLSGDKQVAEDGKKARKARGRALAQANGSPSDPTAGGFTAPGPEPSSGSGNPDNPGGSGGTGGSGGGEGNPGGSSGSPPAGTPSDPVVPDPAVPTDPAPTPDPVPEPEPDPSPTPIPGGPSGIAIPGGPKPG